MKRARTRRASQSVRRYPVFRLAVLALLAAIATAPRASAQQGWTNETLDQWIFQQDRTVAGARTRLNAELSTRVNQIDRTCRLRDGQKRKLQLAGRGDIQRFFDRYEEVKERFQRANADEKMMQEALQVARPLQLALRAGLFHEDSLFYKSLPRTLNDEQLARYDVAEQERRALLHRASIDRAVTTLTQGTSLRVAQRQDFIRLLVDEIKPPPKTVPSPYDFYYALYMACRLPEAKLKPLFDPGQWVVVRRQLDQYKRLEAALRQKGLLPDEEGDDAKAAPRQPPALRK